MENEERITTLRRLLEAEPSDVFLNYALALEYFRVPATVLLGEQQLRKVLEMDETYVPAYFQLGRVYESTHETEKAIAAYKSGLHYAEQKKDKKAANELREAIFMLED